MIRIGRKEYESEMYAGIMTSREITLRSEQPESRTRARER